MVWNDNDISRPAAKKPTIIDDDNERVSKKIPSFVIVSANISLQVTKHEVDRI